MTSEVLLRVYLDLFFTYHRHSLLVTNREGNISDGLQGLYEHDVRLLSLHRLLVNGRPPRPDALSPVDSYSSLAYYVAPPTPDSSGKLDALGLLEFELDRQVVIRVARFVGQGLHEDIEITNHGQTDADLEMAWELDADFADLIEVRGGKRQQEAPITREWTGGSAGQAELRFDYQHPQIRRGVVVRILAPGGSVRYEENKVTHNLKLGPQESKRYCLLFAPVIDGEVQEPVHKDDAFGAADTPTDRARRAWTASATRLRTSNPIVQLSWDRAIYDLSALALGDGSTPAELTVPSAGIPLYGTLFGRDALTTAGQSLLLSPVLAEGALRLLARFVGTKDDDFYDEQPGRIPQQIRDDPLARLGITPWLHDYGDYAAPCAYLVLLGGYHLITGNKRHTREFLETARKVLDWLDERADLDGDGFLEYKTRSPKGQTHQGWKDSGDAVRYEDGRLVEPPVASCELQGYWYAAKLLMAEVFLSMGETSRAFEQFWQALDLKKRFNEKFWMPDEKFIAFALDSDHRQVKSIGSNVGHCLATGIVASEYAADVVRRLMAPDMFSGWGIRTLSAEHPAYNPLKYHLGSVWPSENATIAFGMKRYGFPEECNAICKGLFDAAALFEHHRLPETFGGHPRDKQHPHPGLYPDACAPQAWSASAVAWLVQSMLGMWSYAPLNVLIVEPNLPEWLPDLTLRNLRIGKSRVSIRFRRDSGGRTDFKVIEHKGRIHVLRQPPPEAQNAGPATRLRELVESLIH